MSQDEYNELLLAINQGRNIFLTGIGGSGKSTLIKKLSQDIENIDLTSTTGVSAISICGQTIHRFSGIGVVKETSFEDVLTRVKKKKFVVRNIKNSTLLVIDEISMLSEEYLDLIDYIFRKIRKSTLVMGGIQIIFTGDFHQLPPVNGKYCFLSKTWQKMNLKIIFLKNDFRFTDKEYSRLLKKIRIGQITNQDLEILQSRILEYPPHLEIQPTFLYCKVADTERHNHKALNQVDSTLVILKSIDKIINPSDMNEEMIKSNLELIASENLSLKVGAQVMITSNLDVDNQIANGTRGVIKKITNDLINVQILSGKNVEVPLELYEYHERKKLIATRSQFPLKLAYAITIHKCQGASLDLACIDLSSVFTASQAYVGLSRVRSLEGLYIMKNFNKHKIFTEDIVSEFYKTVEK